MTPDQIDAVALDLPDVVVEQPFRPGVNVYKVAGKVFVILDPADARVTLKCDPALALELRAQFPAVTAGYHVNKRLWNTVVLDGSVPAEEVRDMVEHSYDQVVRGLPRPARERIRLLRPETG